MIQIKSKYTNSKSFVKKVEFNIYFFVNSMKALVDINDKISIKYNGGRIVEENIISYDICSKFNKNKNISNYNVN